jgi:hypothetical protein
MMIVPIADTYAQTLNATLGNQACTINLYQKSTGFYCDLYVSNSLIIGGVICLNLVKIVRDLYLGFAGDLTFYDTQGTNDPSSPGLGTRYLFAYLELSDLAGAG